MKKYLMYTASFLILSLSLLSCSKSNSSNISPDSSYSPGQGKITGTGSATFSITGTASIFTKKADTIVVQANIDPSANVGKQFIIGIVAKAPGTYNFVNAAANPSGNFTSGAVALYVYETVNTAGTIIAHEFASNSGSVTVNSVSATSISGTYTATMSDINNNSDAPVTIAGSFTGNFK